MRYALRGIARVASIEETFPGGVRGTALTGLAVLGLLVVTHLVVPHWSTRYAAYLIAFTVWMAWFILAGVNFIGQR
jgi:hypothetical protein